MTIYTDAASITNEILRRHPEIDPDRAYYYQNMTSQPFFATVWHTTGIPDGVEIEVGEPMFEDYYGLRIAIKAWHRKPNRTRATP